MAIKKTIFIYILLSVAFKANAQYDFVAKKLMPQGHVKIQALKNKLVNTKESNIYYSKLFNPIFPLIYMYDGNCGIFKIKDKTFPLIENFEDGLACDLDLSFPEAYSVYKFTFKKRQYFVLECVNQGSRTSFILVHLFQINKKSIYYYPLWSRYGSVKCLGDFNGDGILDFLKIRNNEKETGYDTFKGTLMSLDSTQNKFKDIPKSKEWIFRKKYTKNNMVEIDLIP